MKLFAKQKVHHKPLFSEECIYSWKLVNITIHTDFFLAEGIASPGEFPWLCLLFTGKETGSDRFLGGCAIVPENKNNDISKGTTSRVITAFHKLRSLQGPE